MDEEAYESEVEPTVEGIAAALGLIKPGLPVIVTTHYDNDVGYTRVARISSATMAPVDGEFWDFVDPGDPGATDVILIEGTS